MAILQGTAETLQEELSAKEEKVRYMNLNADYLNQQVKDLQHQLGSKDEQLNLQLQKLQGKGPI